MGFQDAAILPARASFSTTFHKKYGRGESLGTAICLGTVVGINKGTIHIKYFRSTKPLSMSVEIQVDHMTVIKLRSIWQPSVLEMLPDLRQWCLSV